MDRGIIPMFGRQRQARRGHSRCCNCAFVGQTGQGRSHNPCQASVRQRHSCLFPWLVQVLSGVVPSSQRAQLNLGSGFGANHQISRRCKVAVAPQNGNLLAPTCVKTWASWKATCVKTWATWAEWASWPATCAIHVWAYRSIARVAP